MTNKVKMPEPVAEIQAIAGIEIFDLTPVGKKKGLSVGQKFITTDQAEAYKDACVRELQAAAKDLADWAEHDVGAWPELTPGLKKIRALIPKEPPCLNSHNL